MQDQSRILFFAKKLFLCFFACLMVFAASCTTQPSTAEEPQKQEALQKPADEPQTVPQTTPEVVLQVPAPQPGPVAPTVADVPEDPLFAEKVQQEKVRQEQQHFLVQNYLKSAQNYAEQEKYQDAYQFVLEALKLEPENKDALLLKRVYGQKLGFRADEVAEQMDEAVKMVQVKIEQTKLEVDNRIAEGKRLWKDKKYPESIAMFKQAKEILRWLPYHVADLEGKGRQLDFMIQRAEEENLQYQEDLKKQKMMEAEEQARREEQARLKTLQEQVRNLFRQANIAFEQEKYDLAENFCNQVILLDPENKQAGRLLEVIRQARHAKVIEQNRAQYIEEWKKIFEQVDVAFLPMHEIIQFPSYEAWKEVSKRGSKTMELAKEEESPQDRQIQSRLETESLSMDFTEAPLREVVEFLRTTTNINIIIDPEVYKEFADEESLKVDLTVTKLKLTSILNWILTPKGLAYKISNGVLIISTKKRMVEKPQLRLYNVRDLTGKLNDFPAIDIDLTARKGTEVETVGARMDVPEAAGRPATTITEEQLTTLIKENIAKGTWDSDTNSIDVRHGTLIIRQTVSVHKQIESLLNDLRKATGLLVTIEARFLTVSDDFLEDVGVDWRSLGATSTTGKEVAETTPDDPDQQGDQSALKPGDVGTGYDFRKMDDVVFGTDEYVGTGRGAGLYYKYKDDVETRQRLENIFDQTLGTSTFRSTGGLSMQMAYIDDVELQMILKAVRKRSRSNLLTAPRLTVFNTQRANVTIVKQYAYVQDYEVEIATKSTIADPTVGTVQDGVILDVRPIISADRKYITMEIQPTIAILAGGGLRKQETQLASSAEGPGTVVIELPDINMTKIKTTVTIPDGGTLLLGGLIEASRQDFSSGVPFLSDLPVINFFTTRRGQYSHRQNLLILVTAQITSMEEKEPKEGLQR